MAQAKAKTAKKPAAKKAAPKFTVPKLKIFEITAVIPTVQYGNMQPKYQVEAESFEEANALALPYIENLWARYCAKGSELKINKVAEVSKVEAKAAPAVQRTEMTSELTGVTAFFDPAAHTYVSKDGKPYLSGSKFAHQYTPDFDKVKILAMMKEKYGIVEAEVEEMWKIKGEASMSFGTAIHAALEMYGKFKLVGEVTGANKKPDPINSALHDNPILQHIVEKFYRNRENEDAMYEAFVADDEAFWCGQIDRLLIVDREKKVCRVQDYKTNSDVNKKGFNKTLLQPFDNMPDTPLSGYWLQLSFYAKILKKYGWTVEGLDVLHWDGKQDDWVTYTREVIDLTDF